MANDPNRPSQYPMPSWSSAPPPPHDYHPAPISQYPPPPQSAPPYHYPPPTADMNGVPHPSHPPPPPHMQPPHAQDPYRLPPPPPGSYNQRPTVEYYGPPAPQVAPPQVVYQAAAPRQRTAIACRYCRRRKIRCSGFDSSADGRCSNCVRFNQECMFTPVSSQTQAFVPAQAAYPHLRSMNGMPPAQNSIPPAGRPAGRPAYAAEGVMLYGAYGQPLNTTLRGAPQPPPPAQHMQTPLPPNQGPPGPPLPHHTGAPPVPSQPIYEHLPPVTGPTAVAGAQVAYQPPPPPDQSSRKRPRPEDLHNGSRAASPQLSNSSASHTQAPPPKARAASASTSAPPEQVQDIRNGVNGKQAKSPPSQAQVASPEKNSHQGTKSAPPPSPHPSLPPPHGAEKHDHRIVSARSPLPPSSSLTSAPLSGQPSPAYAAPLYPQPQAYYPPPPPHQAGQPPPPGQDGRPVYVYDQRGGPVNGHAVPPPHPGQPPNPSYPLTAALPMHPRPPHVYQQPPPPAHQYAPPPPPLQQQQQQQQQQGPPPQPSAASQSHPSTQPTPQTPYTSPPLSKPREAVPATTQPIQNGLPSTLASSAPTAEHAHPHTQPLKADQPQPKDIAVPSGNSHAGATVTPPQQTQVPATLQPTSRATPTKAGTTTGGPGSGSSSGRGLSVLDLCGPDSNTAPTAKARSATDSDMLNALSRKV